MALLGVKKKYRLFALLILNNTVAWEQQKAVQSLLELLLRSLPVDCRGRGCDERSMGAALVFYAARWSGMNIKPSSIYQEVVKRIDWIRIPRQSFHNSLLKLLSMLGHSMLFRHALYGRLAVRVCRLPGSARVEWELYGPGPAPPCNGTIEEWAGASPSTRLLWRSAMKEMKIKVGRVTFDARIIVSRLYDFFGKEWFTAREAAVVLALSARTAAAILRKLENNGIVESRPHSIGRNMKVYRLREKALENG